MFRLNEPQRMALPPGRGHQTVKRPGVPVDAWRLVRLFRQGWRWTLVALFLSTTAGVWAGRNLVARTYASSAVLLWEPPLLARADAVREISTLVDSVKLPTNLAQVRGRIAHKGSLEQLASQVDVASGENSMLITITGKARSRQGAAELTTAMVDVFLEEQKKVAQVRLEASAESLRHSLDQSEKGLADARERFDRFRTDHRIGDLGLEVQSAIGEVARLRVAANNARMELEGTEAQERAVRAPRTQAPTSAGNPEEQRAIGARLAQAEADLADARAKYTDEHPKVKLLLGEVSRLRAHLAAARSPQSQPSGLALSAPSATPRLDAPATLRRAVLDKRKALNTILQDAEAHAAKLTSVQGEAAKLLADVTVAQERVAALLKQLSTADDDVRNASSGFQVVSKASLPEHPEKGFGRWVVVLTPVAALLLTLGLLLRRETGSGVVRTAPEVAYWAQAPVLWSTEWPSGSEDELQQLGREMANILEYRPAVVGITVLTTTHREVDWAAQLAAVAQARLMIRGETCAVSDLRSRSESVEPCGLADALEHKSLGEELSELRDAATVVISVLPALDDLASVRSCLRWIDALIVVIPSGQVRFTRLQNLRPSLGLLDHGVGLVLANVPSELLALSPRTVSAQYELFAPTRRRRRPSVVAARLTQTTSSPSIPLPTIRSKKPA